MKLHQSIIVALSTCVLAGFGIQSYASNLNHKPAQQIKPQQAHRITPRHVKVVKRSKHTVTHQVKRHHKPHAKPLSKRARALVNLNKTCRQERKAIKRYIRERSERKQALRDNTNGCVQARQALKNKCAKRRRPRRG